MKGCVQYTVNGYAELPPCNIIDKWNGGYIYDKKLALPCGCLIYNGELSIAEDFNWPRPIGENSDFAFKLVCTCGDEIYYGGSAAHVQAIYGWSSLFHEVEMP